ncbi:MAG: glutamyl-tRNA reductase [Candidatus Melainabacteria bacterium]|nr:MAG: glutamyl-tRNA reductase [Candidatus Melainabacteria bacterium]
MTHLVVCGLNYHNTPIAIRERFTIPQSCVSHALMALSHLPHVKEAAILSTCNRTEVYAVVSNVQAGWQEIEQFFNSAQAVSDHGALKPNFRLLREDVALHLFRVASGLDSMVLGEGQIMSQVKAAYQSALEAKTAGPVLDHLFKIALQCGKRVRSETSMGKRAVSVSSAALELARTTLGDLKDKRIAVIGAGKMSQICVKLLLSDQGSGTVFLLNRSKERVQQFLKNSLPNVHRLETEFDFEDRHKLAATADLVVVSTSAQRFLLERELLAASRSKEQKPLCIVDISVPRNVEPTIANLPGVKLFQSDDLTEVVTKNLAEREALVAEAEDIVFQTLDEFHAWQRSLLVVPTIAGLREKIESIRLEQMAKTRGASLSDSETDPAQIEEISRAIVNQILHHPTVQLKATRDYEILRQQAEALRTLFSLDPLGALNSKKTSRSRLSGPDTACREK